MKLELYDLDAFVRTRTDGKMKAHFTTQECIITLTLKGMLISYFDSTFLKYLSLDDPIIIDTLYADSNDNDTYNSHDSINVPAQEVMENAPHKTIDSKDYFHKRNTTYTERKKFAELLKAFESINIDPETI